MVASIVLKRSNPLRKRYNMVNETESAEGGPDRLAMMSDLAAALENDQFFLVYQPTIDLQTDAFVGVEALLRGAIRRKGSSILKPSLASLKAAAKLCRWGDGRSPRSVRRRPPGTRRAIDLQSP
jgi:predicted signal transduction protein with EAL and GGDEF domain